MLNDKLSTYNRQCNVMWTDLPETEKSVLETIIIDICLTQSCATKEKYLTQNLNSILISRFSLSIFPVVHDRQLCRRLAHRNDMATYQSDRLRIRNLCNTSNTRRILLSLGDEIIEQKQSHWLCGRAIWRGAVVANVPSFVPDLSCYAATFETFYRCIVA